MDNFQLLIYLLKKTYVGHTVLKVQHLCQKFSYAYVKLFRTHSESGHVRILQFATEIPRYVWNIAVPNVHQTVKFYCSSEL